MRKPKEIGVWYAHKGGARPVPANAMVRIQCRVEAREFAEKMAAEPASEFVWKYPAQPCSGDITFYQVVSYAEA